MLLLTKRRESLILPFSSYLSLKLFDRTVFSLIVIKHDVKALSKQHIFVCRQNKSYFNLNQYKSFILHEMVATTETDRVQ